MGTASAPAAAAAAHLPHPQVLAAHADALQAHIVVVLVPVRLQGRVLQPDGVGSVGGGGGSMAAQGAAAAATATTPPVPSAAHCGVGVPGAAQRASHCSLILSVGQAAHANCGGKGLTSSSCELWGQGGCRITHLHAHVGGQPHLPQQHAAPHREPEAQGKGGGHLRRGCQLQHSSTSSSSRSRGEDAVGDPPSRRMVCRWEVACCSSRPQ